MATLTLFQPNANYVDSNYRFDYRVDYDANGWYMQDNNTGDIFGAIFGSGITYNTYGSPTAGTINSASSLAPDGSLKWTISGISINSNSTYSLESVLRDGNINDSYVRDTLLAGNDTIIGSSGNDYFYYSTGRDTINGGAGSDWFDFSNRYFYSTGLNVDLSAYRYTANTGSGPVISNIRNIENIVGSRGDDILTGDAANNTLVGGSGDDTISGGAGNDILNGGDGADNVSGGAGNDLFIGGYRYNDTYNGGTGIDTVSYYATGATVNVNLNTGVATKTFGSSSYTDTLTGIENVVGSAFNDTLVGNAANNVLAGGAGNDTLDGGLGIDTADYSTAYRAVTANLTSGVATGYGNDTLVSIENLTGSTYGDKLTGNSAANVLNGGAGDDQLDGGAGDDVLNGGAGSDWAYYGNVKGGTGVSVDLSITTSQQTVAAGRDTLVSIENLMGSNYADTLKGNGADNILNGSAGNDVLNGGAGRDKLIGGAGKDTLTGGAGNDLFIFNSVTESTAANRDTITDFTRGADKIDVSAIDANVFAGGNQAFTLIASTAPFTDAGQLKFSDGILSGDVTGDGIADFSVALTGVSSLSTSDFIL